MKRFKLDLYDRMSRIGVQVFPSVLYVADQGFIRFDESGHANAFYTLCQYHSGYPGFIKYVVVEGVVVVDSCYVTLNKNLEVRYDTTGKLICEYLNYQDGRYLVYVQLKNGVKTNEYVVDQDDKQVFPEFKEELDKYVEKDVEEFKFFKKQKVSIS